MTTNIDLNALITTKLESSIWLKGSIKALLRRDIIDAEDDVLMLLKIQKVRVASSRSGSDEYKFLRERIGADRSVSYWLKDAVNVLDGCEEEFAFLEAAAIQQIFSKSDSFRHLLN